MKLNTVQFQEACKTILMAVDNSVASLELNTDNGILYLNVTNREYYVSVKFKLDPSETDAFRVVVDASTFLNLVSGITTETFELVNNTTNLSIKTGQSSYKLPITYENSTMITLPKIELTNHSVDMTISLDVLKSILTENSKALQMAKGAVAFNELQKLYYLSQDGCFTFTTCACMNEFTLEKPINILLNERIVKLFKLFKEDVSFSFGHDQTPTGKTQSKVIFDTTDVYVAAVIVNDSILLSKINGPYAATKQYMQDKYANNIVVSVPEFNAAISRLIMVNRSNPDNKSNSVVNAAFRVESDTVSISDKVKNTEVINIANQSSVLPGGYNMILNLVELKLVLSTCKDPFVTLNCGNGKSVIIRHGTVSNLIGEKDQL